LTLQQNYETKLNIKESYRKVYDIPLFILANCAPKTKQPHPPLQNKGCIMILEVTMYIDQKYSNWMHA
jgi:hypothetical protein